MILVYSLLNRRLGVILGYIMYFAITLCTGELLQNFLFLCVTYFPDVEETLAAIKFLAPYMPREPEGESDDEDQDMGLEKDSDVGTRPGLASSIDMGTQGGMGPQGRAESTSGMGGRSTKGAGSQQDHRAILAAFVDMNPSMSFSAPEVLPPRKNKSTKETTRSPKGPQSRAESRDPSRADKDEAAMDLDMLAIASKAADESTEM